MKPSKPSSMAAHKILISDKVHNRKAQFERKLVIGRHFLKIKELPSSPYAIFATNCGTPSIEMALRIL